MDSLFKQRKNFLCLSTDPQAFKTLFLRLNKGERKGDNKK